MKKTTAGHCAKAANNKLTLLQGITGSGYEKYPGAGTKAALPNSKSVLKAVTDSINKNAQLPKQSRGRQSNNTC